jgi:hypothetical protein
MDSIDGFESGGGEPAPYAPALAIIVCQPWMAASKIVGKFCHAKLTT